MTTAVLLARVLLATVFLAAAIGKLADRDGSRQAIRGFGVPDGASRPVAILLPVAELAVAASLLPAGSARFGGLGALALLVLFVVAIVRVLRTGHEVDCHCFGQLHSAPAGRATLLRNVALAAVAAFVVAASWSDPGPSAVAWIADLPAAGLVALGAGAALVLLAGAAAWFMAQLFRQQGRLLLRLEALEAAVPRAGAPAPDLGQPAQGLPVGFQAPPFTLPDLRGDERSLDELTREDAPLVLVFSDPQCGPCQAVLSDVGRWERDNRDRATLAVISRGSADDNRAQADEYGLETVLLQVDRELHRPYRVPGTPTAVAISSEGRIATPLALGPDPIRELLAKVAGPALPEIVHVPSRGPATAAPGAPPPGPAVGGPAPDVTVADLSGRPVRVGSVAGERTALVFWNPSCPFCAQMLDDLRAIDADPPPGAPRLRVVSTGSIEENQRMGLDCEVLLDREFQAARAFGASGTPMAVALDEEGRIASPLAAGPEQVLALVSGGAEVALKA